MRRPPGGGPPPSCEAGARPPVAPIEIFGQVEEHQVGRLARLQARGGEPEQKRGPARGHVDGRGEVQAGEPHDVGHSHADRQARAGEQLFLTGDDQAAVGQDFHLAAAAHVTPRRQSGQARDVADQQASLGGLGAQEGLDDFRRQVMAIHDQAGPQPIFGQLVPEVIRMPAEHAVAPLPRWVLESGAGVDRGADLRAAAAGVADRHDHARGDDAGDERGGLVELGGHGDQANAAAGRLLPGLKLRPAGAPAMRGGMGAARPVLGRKVRPFQVDAGRGSGDVGPGSQAAADRGHAVPHHLEALRGKGWADARHAERELPRARSRPRARA